MNRYRYPGPRPFSAQFQNVFFGREKEIDEIIRLVRQEPLLVIFGQSGLGKSSLLNVGIAPKLLCQENMAPIFIRLHSWNTNVREAPIQIASDFLYESLKIKKSWFNQILPNDFSLWSVLKSAQISNGRGQKPVVIFDQFEELFTFPQHEIESFAQSLAEVFYTNVPDRYRLAVELNEGDQFSEDQLKTLHEPLSIRVIAAIRTDRMALMNKLKPFLPNALNHCYELSHLNRASAEEAILNPAFDQGNYITERFDYEDAALEKIFDFLSTNKQEKIELFQLQILCEFIERQLVEKKGQKLIHKTDINNIGEILENYYLDKIENVGDVSDQIISRRLIEEGLIFEEEERRISLFEGQIYHQFGVNENLLRKLEDTHIIRREPNKNGSYSYEISHDSFLVPILNAKRVRIGTEKRENLERLELLRQQELKEIQAKAEKEKQLRKSSQKLTFIALIVSFFTIIISLIAVNQFWEAKEQQKIAKNKSKFLKIALEKAKYQRQKADSLKMKERIAKNQYKNALIKLEHSTREVSTMLVADAYELINRLDYLKALKKLKSVVQLDADISVRNNAFKGLMELAYFYNEAGKRQLSNDILKMLIELRLVDQQIDNKYLRQPTKNINYTRNILKALDRNWYNTLEKKYYPSFVFVQGGDFCYGMLESINSCPTENIRQVKSFKISRTETSTFQYYLYSVATNKKMVKPIWEWSGYDPAINISWYEAVNYAFWLNFQLGKEQVYSIVWPSGDPNDLHNAQHIKWQKVINREANGFRLPTEIEWEYAARGGIKNDLSIYSGSNYAYKSSWFDENSEGKVREVNSPTKLDNILGLADMSGNAYEWCWDWADRLNNINLIQAPKEGESPIIRGGSAANTERGIRVLSRERSDPRTHNKFIGFRLILSL